MANYFLDEQKTKKLTVKPKAFWKNTAVSYNDVLIDTIVTADEFRQGKTYEVEPGYSVFIQLTKSGFSSGEMIDVRVNGKLLPGSVSDPMTGINSGVGVMIAIGILNAIIGLIGIMSDGDGMLSGMGIGVGSFLIGLVFIGLALWLRYSKNIVPIVIAILLLVADILLTIYYSVEAGGNFPTGVGVKVIFIIGLVKGIKGVMAYNASREK